MGEAPLPGKPASHKSMQEIASWIVDQIASMLFVTPGEIDINAPFNSFGLGSRDLILLSGDLEDFLDLHLSPTLLYDYPNIRSLAAHLAEIQKTPGSATAATVVEDVAPQAQPNSGLEDLSEEEAEALLEQWLNPKKPAED